MPEKIRTARCCCGDVSITVKGEPHYVHGCHCNFCQRRTGSVWQVSCWFYDHEIVEVTGDTQIYVGHPDLSDTAAAEIPTEIDHHFCKRCGSTVYWKIPLSAGVVGEEPVKATGIAVGCFTDKNFPEPVTDHYVCNSPEWMQALQFKFMRDKLPSPEEGVEEMQYGENNHSG